VAKAKEEGLSMSLLRQKKRGIARGGDPIEERGITRPILEEMVKRRAMGKGGLLESTGGRRRGILKQAFARPRSAIIRRAKKKRQKIPEMRSENPREEKIKRIRIPWN